MKLWIARDKNNALCLYTIYYNEYYNSLYKSQMIKLDENLFPEITFENSPYVIELKLIK